MLPEIGILWLLLRLAPGHTPNESFSSKTALHKRLPPFVLSEDLIVVHQQKQ